MLPGTCDLLGMLQPCKWACELLLGPQAFVQGMAGHPGHLCGLHIWVCLVDTAGMCLVPWK